ncbi:MAG: hypothetical protein K2X32_04540, partial [Phycisphaerales bacterium]|nr:hypothetical protein [Phycisphaerales bacterium]
MAIGPTLAGRAAEGGGGRGRVVGASLGATTSASVKPPGGSAHCGLPTPPRPLPQGGCRAPGGPQGRWTGSASDLKRPYETRWNHAKAIPPRLRSAIAMVERRYFVAFRADRAA